MDSSGKKVVVGLVVFSGALGVLAVVSQPVVRLRPARAVVRPLVAVVPFDNLEGDPELEGVASEVTRAVIGALETVDALRVTSFGETLSFRGLEGGARRVADELSADFVLAGSVEREGDRLRLQIYFVKPGDRPRIWADEFRFESDAFGDIPEEIARYVRDALTDSEERREGRPGSP